MREVTVATPTDRVSAEVAVSLLHAMKIPARMVSAIEPVWTLGSALGTTIDLRIVVPEDRAAEARAILGQPATERPEQRSIVVEALLMVTLITSLTIAAALLIRSH